jgi:hypothetical protein
MTSLPGASDSGGLSVLTRVLGSFCKSRKESLPSSCSKGRALDIESRTIRDQGEDFVYCASEVFVPALAEYVFCANALFSA